MGRNDRSREVERKHRLELVGLQVEEVLVGADCSPCHIASCSIEQGVDTAVFGQNIGAVLLHNSLAHHVGLHKFALATGLFDVGSYGVAHLFLASEDYHFGTVKCQILGD